jgi:F0F1-type ATP synthase assembly protein I
MGTAEAPCYSEAMNLLLLIVVLLLLFGGSGFYLGGPAIGGGGFGLVLPICLVIFFMGGFRTKSRPSQSKRRLEAQVFQNH